MAAENRQRIRERVRAARQGLPADERIPLSRAACERLLSLPIAFTARTVLGYAATAEELDPVYALIELEARGARIALPRISGPGMLTLHECTAEQLESDAADHESALEEGPFGIRQPNESSPSVPAENIDLVIVPGVAFDDQGRRLGYGGGYYDRLLRPMRNTHFVGIAFDGQIVTELPEEAHDVRMNHVVTPTRALGII